MCGWVELGDLHLHNTQNLGNNKALGMCVEIEGMPKQVQLCIAELTHYYEAMETGI